MQSLPHPSACIHFCISPSLSTGTTHLCAATRSVPRTHAHTPWGRTCCLPRHDVREARVAVMAAAIRGLVVDCHLERRGGRIIYRHGLEAEAIRNRSCDLYARSLPLNRRNPHTRHVLVWPDCSQRSCRGCPTHWGISRSLLVECPRSNLGNAHWRRDSSRPVVRGPLDGVHHGRRCRSLNRHGTSPAPMCPRDQRCRTDRAAPEGPTFRVQRSGSPF